MKSLDASIVHFAVCGRALSCRSKVGVGPFRPLLLMSFSSDKVHTERSLLTVTLSFKNSILSGPKQSKNSVNITFGSACRAQAYPGFISCDDQPSKLLPATFFPETLEVVFAHVDTSILYVLVKERRNPPRTKTNKTKIFLDGAKNTSASLRRPSTRSERSEHLLPAKTPLSE